MHADGYDPLDPKGNITIKWDLLQSNSDTNAIKNYLKAPYPTTYSNRLILVMSAICITGNCWRHSELQMILKPAIVAGEGIIVELSTIPPHRAARLETGVGMAWQGGGQLPHCCEKKPLIVDLLPGAPYNIQTSNCCKGGVLSSVIQDPTKHAAVFQMNIGAGQNFSLGVPGYTCAKPVQVAPSKYSSDGGRRWTQALGTWNVTCIYSQYQASTSPKCCVSLSAFYNDSIVHCPKCSCSCQVLPGSKCVKFDETPSLLQQVKDPNQEPPSIVRCTQHMCPIRVHWHVKQSYKEYWRVKITVNNLNILKNYSGWNLVALHPNLKSLTQMIVGCFGGLSTKMTCCYKKVRLEMCKVRCCCTKMKGYSVSGKDGFSLGGFINGDECVMPPPDDYPRLPKNTARAASFTLSIIFSSLFMLLIIFAC
ncbi:hypothetical protein J1N35_024629 [Gossypium stocksii]|uniref:COBRA-like protein n=1 Tax=Gossypium stocksii TaxID=47602 RepID=A0A9D3ZWX3_9ROSI|nr:hypothetical protein J1N35_024629 [Gossypium stocksii]